MDWCSSRPGKPRSHPLLHHQDSRLSINIWWWVNESTEHKRTHLRIATGTFFSRSRVRMQELDHKEGWAPKNWCFRIAVLEKTLESPLNYKESKPVHPKGNQPWVFTGRTVAEAEAPILWPPEVKSQLIGKLPDAEKDWRQKEKGAAETRWLDSIIDSMDMNVSRLQEIVKDKEAWSAAVHGVAKSRTWLTDWIKIRVHDNSQKVEEIPLDGLRKCVL